MFDIGFLELLAIFTVALLVIGPEQLPSTVRTIMLWIGRLRRSFDSIKQDIERELGAEDIKRQIHNEAVLEKIRETERELQEVVEAGDKKMRDSVAEINQNISAIEASVNDKPTAEDDKASSD